MVYDVTKIRGNQPPIFHIIPILIWYEESLLVEREPWKRNFIWRINIFFLNTRI